MTEKSTPGAAVPQESVSGDAPAEAEAPEAPEAADKAVDEASAEVSEGDVARAQGEQVESADPPPRRRVTVAHVVVAVLLILLGFTLVVQLKAVATDPTLAAARQEELVRILSDLDGRQERLRQDIAGLQATRDQLTTAGQSREVALAEATRRADELGILAGTLPVEGPGVTVRMRAGDEPIPAATLLDAVQELRGAGAEAIQIVGGSRTAVRVVASTYFVDGDGGVVVDGQLMSGPFTLTVIGDPDTLAPALGIPGGVVESVQSSGGTVIVQNEPDVVRVPAVRAPVTLQYARPVP